MPSSKDAPSPDAESGAPESPDAESGAASAALSPLVPEPVTGLNVSNPSEHADTPAMPNAIAKHARAPRSTRSPTATIMPQRPSPGDCVCAYIPPAIAFICFICRSITSGSTYGTPMLMVSISGAICPTSQNAMTLARST
jgi:hypothetical protein